MIRDARGAALARCPHCEAGFRRVGGVHIGSQRLGMIPDTPCARVFATAVDVDATRPWRAYVDGAPLRGASGGVRCFASPDTAYAAACKAAPRRWHP